MKDDGRMKDDGSLMIQPADGAQATLQRFVALALRGLVPMFDQQKQLFCYSLKKTERGMVREGLSPRYTMMTLMGLQRVEEAGGVSSIEIDPSIEALCANLDWVKDIGDLGVLRAALAAAREDVATGPTPTCPPEPR